MDRLHVMCLPLPAAVLGSDHTNSVDQYGPWPCPPGLPSGLASWPVPLSLPGTAFYEILGLSPHLGQAGSHYLVEASNRPLYCCLIQALLMWGREESTLLHREERAGLWQYLLSQTWAMLLEQIKTIIKDSYPP